jgi:hypothetical protein
VRLAHDAIFIDPHDAPAAGSRIALAGSVREDARARAALMPLQYFSRRDQCALSVCHERAR